MVQNKFLFENPGFEYLFYHMQGTISHIYAHFPINGAPSNFQNYFHEYTHNPKVNFFPQIYYSKHEEGEKYR